MSARILYHETRVFDPEHLESSQFVRVELRQWKDGSHHDVILDQVVVVDGEELVDSSRVLRHTSDATNIRYAIERFDALVVSHPWAKGDPGEVTA